MIYFYLGSIMFFNTSMILMVKAIEKEGENRGYKEVEKPKNSAKSLVSAIKFFTLSAIPILNLAMPAFLIFNFDKITEEIIQNQIMDGQLVKIEENKLIQENQQNQESNVISYNVNNELTREEKIEFLKQEYSILTDKNLVKEEKRKAKQKRR